MEAVRQWAICLLASAVVGAFACIVMPNGSVEKTIKVVSGIFVIAAVCSPLADLSMRDFAQTAAQTEGEYPVNAQALEDGTLNMYDSTIRDAIYDTAQACGACIKEISVELDMNDNCIIIHNVTVELEETQNEKTEKFGETVRERLGFPIDIISRRER